MNPTPDIEQLSLDLHGQLHRLRETGPVVWVPSIERWLVTSRQLVLDALRDPAGFTVDDERFTTAQVVGPSMLSVDEAEHDRHRTPFGSMWRRSAIVGDLSDSTNTQARQLVACLGEAGTGWDLRSGLAAPLAAATITTALGLEGTTTQDLLGWYAHIASAVESATVGDPISGSASDAFDALGQAVQRSVASGSGPLPAVAESGGLSSTELHSNVAVTLFGAIETSEAMTSNALFHVLREPKLVERLQADRNLIGQAIEESLRLEPAAALVDRFVTHDIDFGGVSLKAGDPVALSLSGANRDPACFANPDTFDLDRPNSGQHLAFVHGPHACIGLHLARLETSAAINAVLDRWPAPSLEPGSPDPIGLVFRKPDVVALAPGN